MKNFLKKLDIVQAQPDASKRSEHKHQSSIQNWLSSVVVKNPFTTTTTDAAASASSTGSSNLGADMTPDAASVDTQNRPDAEETEEYQVQLAIELSAREDPEAVQIEAVKQISLGSCSTQNSPPELLAFRYWNYNSLSFDDKILDGFYDLYGVLAGSLAMNMPSLIDLQGTPVSDGICCEAVFVDRAGDPDLLKLEQKAIIMAMEEKSSSLIHARTSLVQKLAVLVADYMGGSVDNDNCLLQAWQIHRNGLKMSFESNVLPLGCIRVGLARHRALLFKVLADSAGVPCQLLKGKLYTGSDDGAMNIVRLDDGRDWIVDLMMDPGTLISSDAVQTQNQDDGNIHSLTSSAPDCENLHVISCSSSSTSSVTSCSSSNEKMDRSASVFGVSSDSDRSTLCESHSKDKKKGSQLSKKSPIKSSEKKSSTCSTNANSQVVQLHEPSLKPTKPYAMLRSPSWTEGISYPVVHKMKVKDVSQYMIDATKENPQLAQKIHNVLLESGVAVPANLFTEVCMEQKETSVEESRKTSENKKNNNREVQDNCDSSLSSLPHPLDPALEKNVAPSRSHTDVLKPTARLSNQYPLDVIPRSSQSGGYSVQERASPIKSTNNMPVAAAVATAALVASSVFVAVAQSNSEGNVEVPVEAAAKATVAAIIANNTAARLQNEQAIPYAPLPCIHMHADCEMVQLKGGEYTLNDENKESKSGNEVVLLIKHETGESRNKAKGSDRSEGTESIISDVLVEDAAEFEISWEEIKLGERIGLGSYGEVYRGEWHGTEVAVKKILEQDLSDDALEEFKSEVRIMKRLRHPNVVLFMGAVTRVPHLSIVTEFLPRGSLFRLIHRPNSQLDERKRLKMALDIARGMNYLHSCCPMIIHRDLKSPNLLVDRNWIVKVSDFGLSRMKLNTFLSSTSTAGTAEWMAPEVLRNEPADEKCDIYSFGVVLWELSTLQQPWEGMNPMQVVGAVGFQHRRLDIPLDTDLDISNIILRCWKTNPAERPSFAEIMADLKPLQKPLANVPAARTSSDNSRGKF